MNRRARRAKAAHVRHTKIRLNELDSSCDIQVDAKHHPVVMLIANPVGRHVVENFFPDVEWSTDDKFRTLHSDEWRFTHVRVTRLPPSFEKLVPLAFCVRDAIGLVVATHIQRGHTAGRVILYQGEGDDVKIHKFDGIPAYAPGDLGGLYAEYVPPGIYGGSTAEN
jgi:hypothetical protein